MKNKSLFDCIELIVDRDQYVSDTINRNALQRRVDAITSAFQTYATAGTTWIEDTYTVSAYRTMTYYIACPRMLPLPLFHALDALVTSGMLKSFRKGKMMKYTGFETKEYQYVG